jgi:hypothetical protein
MIGDMAMKTMYPALLMLIMDPLVPYSAATSGVAARMEVLDIGDKKAQNDRTNTMTDFLVLDSLLYTSSPGSL